MTSHKLKLHWALCVSSILISIATEGFMVTCFRLSTFLQLNSCFCVVKVVVAVGVVCL